MSTTQVQSRGAEGKALLTKIATFRRALGNVIPNVKNLICERKFHGALKKMQFPQSMLEWFGCKTEGSHLCLHAKYQII